MKLQQSNPLELDRLLNEIHRVKVKTQDYVLLHKTLSVLSSPKVIIKSIVDGNFDDVYSKVPDGHKERVMEIANKVYLYQEKMEFHITAHYGVIIAHYNDKIDCLKEVKNMPKRYQPYLYCLFNNKQYSLLKASNGKYITMKEIEEYLDEQQ